jgi:arylsulfatase A-like enzyme
VPPPNILLVVHDATRADACSCYGADRTTTPTLDALAERGVLYEQAITPAPWTLPAFSSLFTGFYPSQMQIYERRKLDASLPTLAELLARSGYATFGISSNTWLSRDFGLQRGFSHFHKQWQLFQTEHEINPMVLLEPSRPDRSWVSILLARTVQGNPVRNAANTAFSRFWALRRDFGASRIARPLLSWTRDQTRPWFAMVHMMEAHLAYKPPLRWVRQYARDLPRARRIWKRDQWPMAWRHIAGVECLSDADLASLKDLYLAEVAYADHHLGLLLEALRHQGTLDNTMIIVTADHGESLGEHGLLNHGYCVYDTLLRVPLVISYPPLFSGGQRVEQPVQSLDLFSTILEAAGAEAPPTASRSLVHPDRQPRPFTVSEYGVPRIPHPVRLRRYGVSQEQLMRFSRGFTALRGDERKLILGTDESVQLYDWHRDPGEVHDLSGEEPASVQELRGRLERFREAHALAIVVNEQDAQEIDGATMARLQGLGYLE